MSCGATLNIAESRPMGRPRTRDFDLPPRVYRRGRSFYFVTLAGKWIPLGQDEGSMRRQWADLYGQAPQETVASLCWRYVEDCMPKAAENTRKQYRSYARAIAREPWGALSPDALKPFIVARWRDANPRKVAANGALSLLRSAFGKAVEWGLVETNPMREVSKNDTEDRARYLTDAEVRAIRQALPEWGRLWLDISYVTGLRVNDVLTIRWDEAKTSIIRRSQKTKVQQEYRVEGDLATVIQEARKRRILGLYVVADEKGRQITADKLQRFWRAATMKAGIEDAQPRDMRAKAGTDAEAQGLDYQALLGHRDRRTSEIYLRNKRTVQAPSLKRKY